MSETYVTQDSFPLDTLDSDLEREGELQKKAGAIRFWIEIINNEKILFIEWEKS